MDEVEKKVEEEVEKEVNEEGSRRSMLRIGRRWRRER